MKNIKYKPNIYYLHIFIHLHHVDPLHSIIQNVSPIQPKKDDISMQRLAFNIQQKDGKYQRALTYDIDMCPQLNDLEIKKSLV